MMLNRKLEYEAKRNPDLARLVANISFLSEDEILSARVKLPWIHQALLMLKKKNAFSDLAANVESWVVDGIMPDPVGETRRWIRDDRFIKVRRNTPGAFTTEIEIKCGQLVWLTGSGVWIDTVFSAVVDPMLLSGSQSCGAMTRLAYMAAVRDRATGLTATGTIDISSDVRDPMSAVRFYRP